MNTRIAKLQDGKWYVVKNVKIGKQYMWVNVSVGFDTDTEAREEQCNRLFSQPFVVTNGD